MGINFPTTPTVGTLWPDPAVSGVPQYTWDGEKWTSGTGGGAIYISDTAPSAPVGSLWWESDTGILYVRYYDGSSTQWVAIAGGDVTVTKSYVDAGDAANAAAIAAGDALRVLKAGDTMSGPLIVPVKGNQIGIHGGAGATTAVTPADANFLLYGGGANWAGVGADASGNVWIRTGLSGTPVPALQILNDQQIYMAKPSAVDPANFAQGTYYFGNSGTKYLNYDGTYFNMNASLRLSAVYSVGSVTAGNGGTTGTYYFGNTGTKQLNYDGSNFYLSGGDLILSRPTAPAILTLDGGSVSPGGYTKLKAANADRWAVGSSGSMTGGTSNDYAFYSYGTSTIVVTISYASGNVTLANDLTVSGGNGVQASGGLWIDRSTLLGFKRVSTTDAYLQWDASTYFRYGLSTGTMEYYRANSLLATFRGDLQFLVASGAYKPGGGSWADSSDARIKNVEGEYTRGLDEITQLRPVYYTFKGNDTHDAPTHNPTGNEEEDVKLVDTPVSVPYPNSNHASAAKEATRYTGLIAQEVETVFPEMVTKRSAYIDGVAVDDLRDLDTTPLVFALINAVKELKARVEQLETV